MGGDHTTNEEAFHQGYGKATAVRVSSYRPLVRKRLVRGRYEYSPNTGSWRRKRHLVGTWGFSCTFKITMGEQLS